MVRGKITYAKKNLVIKIITSKINYNEKVKAFTIRRIKY